MITSKKTVKYAITNTLGLNTRACDHLSFVMIAGINISKLTLLRFHIWLELKLCPHSREEAQSMSL